MPGECHSSCDFFSPTYNVFYCILISFFIHKAKKNVSKGISVAWVEAREFSPFLSLIHTHVHVCVPTHHKCPSTLSPHITFTHLFRSSFLLRDASSAVWGVCPHSRLPLAVAPASMLRSHASCLTSPVSQAAHPISTLAVSLFIKEHDNPKILTHEIFALLLTWTGKHFLLLYKRTCLSEWQSSLQPPTIWEIPVCLQWEAHSLSPSF